MADENDEDTPMRMEEDSDSDSGSGSGSGSEDDDARAELMVNKRQKRATAGNRLANLLQQEEADDELELLFEEVEDDVEFDADEADSDVQMDSSDDDDDKGPEAGEEDLEGEKELQKQARAEKLAKKKKVGDGIPKVFKRVKIDPTASQAPAPRPKKKSERASWLPTAEEAPSRASKRTSTKQSKEQLHAQMVDREIKRVKQLETMEKAQAAKEAAKKPAMTQADRLAEAARVEKRNAKSLSRWEEAEQQREEEQLAKLAALSNRHLDGPVITWWSGMATWVGGTLKKVGKTLELEDPKEKQSRKRKAAEMEAASAAAEAAEAEEKAKDHDQVMKDTPNGTNGTPELPKNQASEPPPSGTEELPPPNSQSADSLTPAQPGAVSTISDFQATGPETTVPAGNQSAAQTPSINDQISPSLLDPQLTTSLVATAPNELPANVPQASPVSLTPNPSTTVPTNAPTSSLAPPSLTVGPVPLPSKSPHPPFRLAPPQQYQHPSLDGSSPLPGFGPPPPPHSAPSQTTPFSFTPQSQLNQPPPPPPPGPPAIEHAARNYVILSNFNEDLIKDKHVQTQILMNKKFVKCTKNKRDHEVCAITSYPAKFRDPSTGLPYCSSYAYKEIQKLKRGEYRWSKLVGAYVGQGTYAARGVPPRFTNPKAQKPTPTSLLKSVQSASGSMAPPPVPVSVKPV